MKKWISSVATVFLSLGIAQSALATPAEIIILRHGEKPTYGNDLNKQGKERARELVDFFKKDPF